jgi:hypothetical protein
MPARRTKACIRDRAILKGKEWVIISYVMHASLYCRGGSSEFPQDDLGTAGVPCNHAPMAGRWPMPDSVPESSIECNAIKPTFREHIHAPATHLPCCGGCSCSRAWPSRAPLPPWIEPSCAPVCGGGTTAAVRASDFFVPANLTLTQHIVRNPPPSARARFCHFPLRSMSSAGRRDSLAHRNDQRDAHGHACAAHRWRQEENSLWCGSAVLNECSADSCLFCAISTMSAMPTISAVTSTII